MEKKSVTIAGFAGRRIDAPGSNIPRFPLSQIDWVQKQIEAFFKKEAYSMLICSAACGADLIALHVAQTLGMHFRIILPFAPEQFRMTSVMDRPGTKQWNWGVLFDQVIGVARENGELLVVQAGEDRFAAYQAVNNTILKEVVQERRTQSAKFHRGSTQELPNVQAVIVWDGQARGPRDLTLHFADEARAHELIVKEILTFPK